MRAFVYLLGINSDRVLIEELKPLERVIFLNCWTWDGWSACTASRTVRTVAALQYVRNNERCNRVR